MSIGQHMFPLVSGPVDGDTRAAIIRLNQKLKNLHAELVVKLMTLGLCDETSGSYHLKKQLSTLASEVERALQCIDVVINVVASEDQTNSEFLKIHRDVLEEYHERALFLS